MFSNGLWVDSQCPLPSFNHTFPHVYGPLPHRYWSKTNYCKNGKNIAKKGEICCIMQYPSNHFPIHPAAHFSLHMKLTCSFLNCYSLLYFCIFPHISEQIAQQRVWQSVFIPCMVALVESYYKLQPQSYIFSSVQTIEWLRMHVCSC